MHQQRTIVVGAGIIGLSTAYSLLQQGFHQVTVLEQATVDHNQASSHGMSRLLRLEYGNDAFYSEMVRLSLKRWKQLEQRTHQQLYTPTGVLSLGFDQEENFTKQSYYTIRELGHSPERLTQHDCAQRFPQFNTQGFDFLTYNLEAGMLHASTCLQTLRACIQDMGGTILEHHQVTAIEHADSQRPIRLKLANGHKMEADQVVVATGPWVHRLLGEELALPVRLTRQYLLYFANLPIQQFSRYVFPAFMADDLYGFPIHTQNQNEPALLKAASHIFGAPAEPGEVPPVDERVIRQVVRRLYNLIPALRDAELARVESYIYDVSQDEDFILDYLPGDARIVLGTGFTGHAFKFGILLGEMLSSLLTRNESVVPLARFQLSRFAHQWQTPTHSVA
ncbi:N-methyltryptophan oxidase [Dictyobacter alpinus]|uniref:N-methyltryptophan oxidase n=1 Tax=Dictyobacter alpinus TaxID=2014873 RepID=A0A402B8Q1_9CHLR|nr:FAD-dependent oxidoreductase [Dictyobacter alpinus]GCE27725.1 N-methyltryptophan oxidase [Dictyobacter alpinus]